MNAEEKYYQDIKDKLIDLEVSKKVSQVYDNYNDLKTRYDIGKMLVEAQGGEKRAKYGDELIKRYSERLTRELGKGYSTRNLKKMRKFYLFQKEQTLSNKTDFSLIQKWPTMSAVSWSHYVELLSLDDINEINYYICICNNQKLSIRELREKIKSNEYGRLNNKTKDKLINKEENSVSDLIKNPIKVNISSNIGMVSEKFLKQAILRDMEHFLNELGEGFSFIKSEYKIKVENNYNYIDILLFNYKYNCFIVVELKITKLKKEHIGQVEFYMNYIDENITNINHSKTIGIIICLEDNKPVIRYCSNPRIFSTTYKLNYVK